MTKERASLALPYDEYIARLEKQGEDVLTKEHDDGTVSHSVLKSNGWEEYIFRCPEPFDVGRAFVKPDGRVVFSTPAALWLKYKGIEALTATICIEEKTNLVVVIFDKSAKGGPGSLRVSQLSGIATVKVPALAGLSSWSDLAWLPDRKSLVAGF
jgi:hypothetical protein